MWMRFTTWQRSTFEKNATSAITAEGGTTKHHSCTPPTQATLVCEYEWIPKILWLKWKKNENFQNSVFCQICKIGANQNPVASGICPRTSYNMAPTVWKSVVIYRRSSVFLVFVRGATGTITTVGGATKSHSCTSPSLGTLVCEYEWDSPNGVGGVGFWNCWRTDGRRTMDAAGSE